MKFAHACSVVNKDLTHKAKAKDLPSRTNPRTALDWGGTDSNYFSITVFLLLIRTVKNKYISQCSNY